MSKLYISAGHGGKDPGAVKGTRQEKNYTLQIAGAVSDLLRAAGHEVLRDRTTDVQTLINGKVKAANNAKVDAVFDIHLNAGGGTGCEVYYTRHGGIGKMLAENICAEIAKLGYSNRGATVKKNALGQDYFGIIRDTKAPANLVECCFIDSDTDMTRLNVQSMAQAIVNGILSVYPAVQKPAPAPTQPAPAAPKNPHPAPTVNVKKGAKERTTKGVKWIQWALKQRGHDLGKAGIDGDFGTMTDKAVRAFQKAQKIAVDGIVGPVTRGKLK